MVSEDIVEDMDFSREILSTSDVSVVVVKDKKVLITKKGDGIRPILETIEELGEDMHNTVVGDRILGRASALLCRYSQVRGVYSPQATKTAIALLIMGGVPSQIDEMIPYIKNKKGDGLCLFEAMLQGIESPEEAYDILYKAVHSM